MTALALAGAVRAGQILPDGTQVDWYIPGVLIRAIVWDRLLPNCMMPTANDE